MLVKLSTDKTVSEAAAALAAALQAAVQANRFGVMQVHNLNETLMKKGGEFGSIQIFGNHRRSSTEVSCG